MDEADGFSMKCELGALVRGSDAPISHRVHKTAVIRRRAGLASDTNTFGRYCVENRRQKSGSRSDGNKLHFFTSGRGSYDAEGNFLPPRRRLHQIPLRPSSTFTGLARHEGCSPWVDSMSTFKANRSVSRF